MKFWTLLYFFNLFIIFIFVFRDIFPIKIQNLKILRHYSFQYYPNTIFQFFEDEHRSIIHYDHPNSQFSILTRVFLFYDA